MRRRMRTFRRRLRNQLQRKRIIARPPFGKRSGRRRVLALVPVAVLGLAASAQAFWPAHGSGTATGSVSTLAAPTISSANPGAGSVELAWSTITPPLAGEVTYYVSRDGGAPSAACPGSSAPGTQTSCTDTGVSVGTHSYTVTAVWRSWTARSKASSVHVSFGPATHLLLTPASTTPTAGTGDALTITAQDAGNNTVATYTGEKSLTFGGASAIGTHSPTVSSHTGSAIAMGTAETISFSNGVASVSGSSNGVMTLYRAETASITVTDGAIGNGSGVSVTVNPTAANSLSAPAPAAQTAGKAFEETITAKDEYGNTATGYTGAKTIAFSGPSSSPSGKAPSYPASVTFAEGAGTASITLYDAQSTTLTAKEGTLTGTSGSFTVNPSGAATFAPGNPGAQTAGKSFEETLTAKDEYANIATSYSGAKTLTFSGPSSSPGGEAPKYPASVSFSEGAGKATITLYDAQTTTLTAKEGSISGTSGSFTVGPAGAASFSVPTPATQTAGKSFEETIAAKDEYGNAATGYSGAKTIAFSGPSSSPSGKAPAYPASVSFSEGAGKASITLYDAQSTALTVKEGSISGTSGSFTVNPVGAASFSMPTPAAQTAGKAFAETITAKDEYGNVATGFTGSKTIAFSGPSSSPSGKAPSYPASVTFAEGAGTASITLYDAQSTTLTATEGSVTGTSGSFTVNAGAAKSFSLATPGTQTAGKAFEETITAKDEYGNVAKSFAEAKTVTFSGPSESPSKAKPVYPATVTFSEGAGTASITLYGAQSTTLTATEGSISGKTESFTVNAAAIASIVVTNPGALTAGTEFKLAITAKDEYGNGVGGSQALSFSGPAESPNKTKPLYPSTVSFTSGEGKAAITLYDGQKTTITVKQATVSGASTEFTVSPATAASFSVPAPEGTIAGKAFEDTITALDSFGNTATSYAGAKTIAFSGPSSSPSGEAPKYPASVTFTEGVGKASITLTDAQSTTLTAKEGTVSGASASFTIAAGTPARLGWTHVSVSIGTPSSPCLFTCEVKALGNFGKFTANVSVTDTLGNTVSGLGAGHKVSVTTAGGGKINSGASLTISTTGAADSTAQFTFEAQNGGWTSDTLAAATSEGTSYTEAKATVFKN